jgi:hypothetical protein
MDKKTFKELANLQKELVFATRLCKEFSNLLLEDNIDYFLNTRLFLEDLLDIALEHQETLTNRLRLILTEAKEDEGKI